MLSFLVAAFVGVPPPVDGDDRTAILYAVNHLLELVDTGTSAQLAEALDPTGRSVIVDRRGEKEEIRFRSLQAFIDDFPKRKERYAERIGIPTVLQRGSIAHVWAPYAFWVDGKKSHCGIDTFQLLNRDGKWIITDLSFTMEKVDNCAALGAPDSPR